MLSFLRGNASETLGNLLYSDICFNIQATERDTAWLTNLSGTLQVLGFSAVVNVVSTPDSEALILPLALPMGIAPLLTIKKDIKAVLNELKNRKVQKPYLFIEADKNCPISELEDAIFQLELQGYQPILTLAESFICLQDNYRNAKRLMDRGCLFHTNILAFAGYCGQAEKRLAEKLLTDGLVSFLGTGIASEEGLRHFKSFNGSRKLLRLLANNPIKNKELLSYKL
ncbi:MAG: hypothetical protein QHC79_03975 [Pseudosphingobacterium sp.]|nr:hypothetical protein [Olivibacter sp. UJ_SKK_5.1]MDX3912671.1 hypothetical protein [Pseudosphingobacterium sp.]